MNRRPLVIAHRGASRRAPENTLVALREAVLADADACEFDIRATRDGHLVLMHDEKLERTTDGRGLLADHTLEEVRRLDAGRHKGRRFAGEGVPTLAEALALLDAAGCRAVVEVKDPGIARRVARAVRDAGMLARTTLISFDPDDLRDSGIPIRRGLVVKEKRKGPAADRAEGLAGRARDCGADLLDLRRSMLDEELVRELHSRGLPVWTWTVDDPALFAAFASWGVDAITTNVPHPFARS